MAQYKMILTDVGKAAIADAIANNTTVKLDAFAIGDGDGFSYPPDASMIKLVNERWRGRIEQVAAEQNNQRKIVATIPADVGGFFMREIGIYDDNGVLIAVGNTAVQYKPLPSEGMAKAIKLGLIIKADNVAVIELIVNEDMQTATKQDITSAVKQHADKSVTSEDGVHDFKYIDGKAYVKVSGVWQEIQLAGLSAYQLAVQEGFVGTLSEWLASLKGSPGDDTNVTHLEKLIGNTPLETTAQTVTAAINEVKQIGNNVKSNTVSALLSVDNSLPITVTSSWSDIIGAIDDIETGVDTSDATATEAQILSGQSAYVKGIKLTGSMEDNGAVASSINAGESYTIPIGYHNGSGKVTANSLSSQTSATAAAADILSGQTAYVNGTKLTGTMTNRGAVSQTLGVNGTYTIPAGYHNGSGKVTQSLTTKAAATITPSTTNQTIPANVYTTGVQTILGDSDLIPSNIKSGVDIFGVVGTMSEGMRDASGSVNVTINDLPLTVPMNLPFTLKYLIVKLVGQFQSTLNNQDGGIRDPIVVYIQGVGKFSPSGYNVNSGNSMSASSAIGNITSTSFTVSDPTGWKRGSLSKVEWYAIG